MHLIQIPPDAGPDGRSPLKTLWPMVAPLLQRAVDYSDGVTTIDEVAEDIASKRAQLWVIVGEDKKITAAGVSAIQRYKSGMQIATIRLFGGEDIKAWFSLKDQFEAWAKTEGCKEVKFYARKGWIRHLPDYQLAQYVMRKKL